MLLLKSIRGFSSHRSLVWLACAPVALLGLSAASQAAEWVLEPGSQVTFEYSYGTDPYEGRFTNVQANFDIDPMRPTSCKFDVTINIEDIDVDHSRIAFDRAATRAWSTPRH